MNVKAKIVDAGKTITEVAEMLTKKKGEPVSVQNLSQKIRRQSLRLVEAEDIADVIGDELVWQKKIDYRQKQADEIALMDLLGGKYDMLYEMGFAIVRR